MKPILFNTEMVKAILDGRKTVTRRLPSSRIRDKWYEYDEWATDQCAGMAAAGIRCERSYEDDFYRNRQPYEEGEVLYVRETWKQATGGTAGPGLYDTYLYKADEPQDTSGLMVEERWHPSIHMPKAAARIFLRVTEVRLERLREISEDDALKEGCTGEPCHCLKEGRGIYGCTDCMNTGWIEPPELDFMYLWEKTVPKDLKHICGWDANPWVWVIGFERISREEVANAEAEFHTKGL